jgi:drug/metabolite transporter (DMT)-like permease
MTLTDQHPRTSTSGTARTGRRSSGHGLGYALAIGQAVLFATSGVLARYSYGTGLSPQQVTALRFFGTFAIVAVALAVTQHRFLSRQPLVYMQGVLFAAANYLYMFAVNELSAGLATVIFFAYPAVVAVLAVPMYRERLTRRTVIAIVLALGGIVLISGILTGGVGQLSPLGLVYAIAGMIGIGVYALLGQKTVAGDHPLTITATVTLISSLIAVVAFPTALPALGVMSAQQWVLAGAIAVFSAALPVMMQLAAIRRIGATKASLIGILETPVALLFAYLALGETLTGNQVLGSALVVASVLVITVRFRRRRADV